MIQTAEIRENLKIPLPSVVRRVMTLENERVLWYRRGRSLLISADILPDEDFPNHEFLDVTTIMDGRYVRPPTTKLDEDILKEFSADSRTLEDVLSQSMAERTPADELAELIDEMVEHEQSGEEAPGWPLPEEFSGLMEQEVDNVVVFFLLEEELLKGNRVAYLVTQNSSTLIMRHLID